MNHCKYVHSSKILAFFIVASYLFGYDKPEYLHFKGEIRQNVLLMETLLPVHYDILDGHELYHLGLVPLELLLTL